MADLVSSSDSQHLHHTIVYSEPGRFAGWPANNGGWCWSSATSAELLVGFTTGPYRLGEGHNISRPYTNLLARSLDGGLSWQVETPQDFVRDGAVLRWQQLDAPLSFQPDHICFRVFGTGYHGCDEPAGGFWFSQDRGFSWNGPFPFNGLATAPQLEGMQLTPRTDYILESTSGAIFFLSARRAEKWGSDRVFAARTVDGGCSFEFLSWIVPPTDPYRAVMPSTLRLEDGSMVSALRRRDMRSAEGWIDAYRSSNIRAGWEFLGRVGETGGSNGNPPALLLLGDGRLVCAYGQRTERRVVARFSHDSGKTWGDAVNLRTGYQSIQGGDADFGYPRLFRTGSGELVAVYYWADRERPEQHIAATIWDPGTIR